MESLSSSVSTVSSFEDVLSHNMWNPLLKLLFHEQVSGVSNPFVDEIDLAMIAPSCHFALDSLYHDEILWLLCHILTWIVFLSHCRVYASTRIRTDTTLDQDCVLKATVFENTSRTVCLKAIVQVCKACMDVSLFTTCVRVRRGRIHKTQTQNLSVLPTDSCTYNSVYKHNLVLKKRLLCLRHPRASLGPWLGSQSRSPSGAISQSSQSFVLLVALALLLALEVPLLCSLLSWSNHREASKFSTFPWFHSVRASVSMFTIIIDNCLFLFLLLFLLSPTLHRTSMYTHTATSVCTLCMHSLYSFRVCVYTKVHVRSCIRVCLLCTHTGLWVSP